MKIFNIRLGLAMNSSSTHSIIILPAEKIGTLVCDGNSEFGWEYFTASSKESKEFYLMAAIQQSLYNIFGGDNDDLTAHVMKEIYGCDSFMPDPDDEWKREPYIDHQSEPTLPMSWDGLGVNEEFAAEFRDFLLNDRVVVLGGNDNDEADHPFINEGKLYQYPLIESDPVAWIARKDPVYNHWTLFRRNGGGKFRMSFDLDAEAPVKSSVPELIDVKITNWCPFDCQFCYMDSTERGIHGDLMYIKSLAEEFGYHQVFEVALGGGEPTLHPNFVEILQVFRDNNIIPNFTTKNLGWLKDEDQREAIFSLMGGFAYSIDTIEDIKNLEAAFEEVIRREKDAEGKEEDDWHYRRKLPYYSVQHVVGANENIKEILEYCRSKDIRLVLLGYKTDGRGDSFKPLISAKEAYEQVIEWRETQRWYRIGIDTVLAQQWEEMLHGQVFEVFWTTQEGAFSMYIDAVEKTASSCSYGNPVRLPYNIGNLKEIFSEF